MPADTLEAPPQSAHDVFKSVESFETSTPRQIENPTPAPESKPDATTADKPAPDAGSQELIDKPDAMKKTGEKKSALDKVGQVKKPEAEKPAEQKPNGTPESKPVDMGNARQLREAYDKQKTEFAALKAELDKVRPDYEQIKKDFDLTREELTKLKAMNLNEDERKRFDGLREMHARYELESSTEYQQKVMAPIQMRIAKIDKVATEAKLDPAATVALKDAMDIPDELDRNREIRRIFKAVEGMEPDDFSDFYSSMTAVGKELNEQLYPQMEAKLRSAVEIEQAARLRDKEQAEQKTTAEKAEFQKEHAYVHKLLSEESLKPLLEETDLAIDGVTLADAMKGAEAADNSRDRAYQAHAGAALPFVIQYTNKLLQELHELKTANKIRNGSAPSRNDALSKAGEDRPALSAKEVFQSVATFER